MNDDTVQIFHQYRTAFVENSQAIGKLCADPVWERCWAAVQRLPGSKSWKAEFAAVLAKAQFRLPEHPPKQASWPGAILSGLVRAHQYRWRPVSRRTSRLDALHRGWLLARFYAGSAWPYSLVRLSAQSALVEAQRKAFWRQVGHRCRQEQPIPKWLQYAVAYGMGSFGVLLHAACRRHAEEC